MEADEYLLELLRYIHLNPIRAHMVRHPLDYQWSSHHAYVDRVSPPWLTTDFLLRMFHADREPAIAAYTRFVDEDLDNPSPSPLLERNPNDTRILGSDNFAGKLLNAAWRPRSRTTLPELIVTACRQFSVTESALRSPSCQRHLTHARAWIAYQAIIQRIASLSAVARHFPRSEAALRQSIKHHFNYP